MFAGQYSKMLWRPLRKIRKIFREIVKKHDKKSNLIFLLQKLFARIRGQIDKWNKFHISWEKLKNKQKMGKRPSQITSFDELLVLPKVTHSALLVGGTYFYGYHLCL